MAAGPARFGGVVKVLESNAVMFFFVLIVRGRGGGRDYEGTHLTDRVREERHGFLLAAGTRQE